MLVGIELLNTLAKCPDQYTKTKNFSQNLPDIISLGRGTHGWKVSFTSLNDG